jgi:hypothetical protein
MSLAMGTPEVAMSEVDEFLATTLDRLIRAEQALLFHGDLPPGWRCGQPSRR